jgi:hypothetical protein
MPTERTHEHVYDEPWEAVIEAYEAKFDAIPNAEMPDLLSVEWSAHSFEEDLMTARCQRDAKTRINVPSTLEYLIGVSVAHFQSDIAICRAKREMKTHSKNITFSSAAMLEEWAHFEPDPSDPTKTKLTVTAKFGLYYLPFSVSTTDKSPCSPIIFSPPPGRSRKLCFKLIFRWD